MKSKLTLLILAVGIAAMSTAAAAGDKGKGGGGGGDWLGNGPNIGAVPFPADFSHISPPHN